jgi:hypothetical protein
MGAPVPIAFASNKRSSFPQAIALNVLSERSPTKPSTIEALIGRACVQAFTTVGTAPIRGVYAQSGLLGGQAFVVARDQAYLVTVGGVVTTLTGTIDNDGPVDIAGGLDQDSGTVIRIATGTGLFRYDRSVDGVGTTVVEEDFPEAGGAGASSVAYFAGYWLAVEAGTDYFYYQPPAITTWGALEFASAEYGPDPLKAVRVIGDQAAFLGAATLQFGYLTGDAANPIGLSAGQAYGIGCRNGFTAVDCKGSLIFVTDDSSVVLTEGGAPRLISDNGLAEQIRRTDAADLSAAFFVKDQHPCYVLHLGTAATWVYDLSSERWSQFSSLGFDYWRPRFIANMGDVVIASDRNSHTMWTLDPDVGTDDGDPVPKEFYAFIEVAEGTIQLGNVVIDCLLGDAPTSDPGDESVMVMQVSRDGTESWSSPRERGLGVLGSRRVQPRWNGLGMVRAPGAVLKFASSCAGRFRVSGVRANVSS